MWYWTKEKDAVFRINEDGTRDGRPLDDPEIEAWLADGNTPTEWSPE